MRTDIRQGALRAVSENEQYWPLFNTVNRTNEGLKQLLLTHLFFPKDRVYNPLQEQSEVIKSKYCY